MLVRGTVLLAVLVAASGAASRSLRSLAALAPPVLEPFDGRWHADTFVVEGRVDSVRAGSWVRILRDGAVVDSVSTSTRADFRTTIALSPGDNTITAVLRDAAFQESPPSRAVVVRFSTDSGFFVPVPFAPGASFQWSAIDGASGAQVRVYDMVGDLVVRFESRDPRTYYTFVWDGRNASHESVRRGPLIAVGILDYPDGTRDIERRAFLFDPEASP
jgi:hypothetical protein